MKLNLRSTLALAVGIALAGTASAQSVKGMAQIGITQPATKVVGKEVVTTLKVKNLSKAAISGLRDEEYWYDKQGNPAPGGSRLLNQPLSPNAVVDIELRTPQTPSMDRNNYQFSHANGQVTAKVLARIE